MTIIAYRDGVLAGDSKTTEYNLHWNSAPKVIRAKVGTDVIMVGFAGNAVACDCHTRDFVEDPEAFLAKIFVDETPVAFGTGDAIVEGILVVNKKVFHIESYDGNNFLWTDFSKAKFLSIGAGKQLAIGALAVGASAVDACRVACKYDAACGKPMYKCSIKVEKKYVRVS